MARITSLPSPEIIRGFKGLIDFVEWRGIFYVRKWPVTPRSSLSAAHFERAKLFGDIVQSYSNLASLVLAFYQEDAADQPRTARDLHVSAVLGHLHERKEPIPPEVIVGWELIEEIELLAPAGSIDFQNIPQTYLHLAIFLSLRSDRPGQDIDEVSITFNNSAVGYDWARHRAGSLHASDTAFNDVSIDAMLCSGPTSPPDAWGDGHLFIYDYTSTTRRKTAKLMGGMMRIAANTIYTLDGWGEWQTADEPITRVTLAPLTGPNFIAGSKVSLWGIAP